MSDTNRKNTGRVKKSEAGGEASKPKAKRPKQKAVANSENTPTANHSAPNEIKELPTANSKLQTEQMEVHHHPEVEKKGLKEYLLEGLMIFIAVMMGFIAENIRENITNKEHARQLTEQLVQDLKADTGNLNYIYHAQTEILNANDSLFIFLKQPLAKADLNKIQRFIIKSHNLWLFHATGGAILAIKNELHLKQLSESRIISYIASYESDVELIHTVQDIYLQYQRSMLDPFLRQHFTPDNLYAAFAKKPLPDTQMRNLTQADLTQLRSDIVLIRVVSKEILDDNTRLKKSAVELLKYVQKQYDLE